MNIAICDDEPYIRSYLASLIRKQDPHAVITEYASADAYLSDPGEYDLLFLDIQLHMSDTEYPPNPTDTVPWNNVEDTSVIQCQTSPPDSNTASTPSCIDGMELARRIRAMPDRPQPILIFVTGYEAYVYDAFDVDAFHYLLKPIDELRFAEIYRRAAARITAKAEQQSRRLVIQYAGTSRVLDPDSIYYMESRDHKIVLHLKDTTLEYYARLGDLEQALQGQFCRIHKGYLVNLAHVEAYTKTEVSLTNGVKLNISKYKYEAFAKTHLHFIQSAEP